MYGTFNIDQRFDQHVGAKDDSYFKEFIRTTEKYYRQSVEVSIVVKEQHVKYNNSKTQHELMELQQLAFSNDLYIANESLFWLPIFKQWAQMRGIKSV